MFILMDPSLPPPSPPLPPLRTEEADTGFKDDPYLFDIGKMRGAAHSVAELTKLEEDARALYVFCFFVLFF